MGQLLSIVDETYPPKSTFTVEEIPDLSGKIMIVTGANTGSRTVLPSFQTGIGKETVKALLVHNAKVYLTARDIEKGMNAIAELKEETGKEAILLQLDLSDFDSIERAVTDFTSKERELHVLINNAGVMAPPIKDVTTQGYDLQFGTNVLGHFYLTRLLVPSLIAGSKSSLDGKARVINVSSAASRLGTGIDFNTLKDGPNRRKKMSNALYIQSKFGNVVFSNELARRYGNEGIVSIALNPGNLQSDLLRHYSRLEYFLINLAFRLKPVPFGALTQLYAATSPEGSSLNGKYLIPWARVGIANPVSQDTKLGEDLWNWMEDQVSNREYVSSETT